MQMDQSKLEILKMAREIVDKEYTDKRAQDHNKWLTESERMWAARGIKVPYPDIPPYPNEEVVIAKAKALLEFVGRPSAEQSSSAPSTTNQIQQNQPEPVKQSIEEMKNFEDMEKIDYVKIRSSDDIVEGSLASTKMISDLYKQINDLKMKIGRL